MKILTLIAISTWLFVGCAAAEGRETDDGLIVPGLRVGAVAANADEDRLKTIYGEDKVASFLIGMGEGFVCHGSRVAFDETNHLEIAWRDAARKSGVAHVRVEGPRWRTSEGLRHGLRLTDVEELNGRAFTLTGFGWDYGGTVLSWNGGKLGEVIPQQAALRTIIRLSPGPDYRKKISAQELRDVSGDRNVSSDHPAMQKLNPVIYELTVTLSEGQCDAFFHDRASKE